MFLSSERSALQDALADVTGSDSPTAMDPQTFNDIIESLWSFSNLNVLPTSGSATLEIKFGEGLKSAARRYYAEKWELALGDSNFDLSEYMEKAQAFLESERNRPGQPPDVRTTVSIVPITIKLTTVFVKMLEQCTRAVVEPREAEFHDDFDRLVDSEAMSGSPALGLERTSN